MALLGAMTMLAYPLFPVGGLAGPVIAAIVGGIAVGAIILVESMVPDIADEDKLDSGEEREGLYFGFWRLGQKLARSITLGLTGVLLSWIGYEEAVAQQSEETARRLAWAFGLGPGSLFLAASLVFLLVPLSRQRQLEIQRRMNQ
jgi:GPH family glycoside/pentoside/hexuronide:cation symporter